MFQIDNIVTANARRQAIFDAFCHMTTVSIGKETGRISKIELEDGSGYNFNLEINGSWIFYSAKRG